MSTVEMIRESANTPAHAGEEIAPFYLARVGGVSAQQLGNLSLARTVENIRIAAAAEAQMTALAVPVEEALFRLVPQTGQDQELRRRVLRIKRNVHNSRIWPEAVGDIEAVAEALTDVTERELLRQWHELAVEREDALGRAAGDYNSETAMAAQALARAMCNQELQAGIAIASPNVLAELLRAGDQYHPEEWRPVSKLARSSLAYLTRAALKTSPLSTFTQLAVGNFDSSLQTERQATAQSVARSRNVIRLVRTLPLSWLMLIARDRELAAAISFEPNAGLSPSPDKEKIKVLTTDYAVHGSFAARSERIAERKFDPSRMPVLAEYLNSGQRVSHGELMSLIEADRISQDAHLGLVALLDAQLVRPVAPYSQLDARPLAELALALSQLDGPRAARISALMRGVQNMTDSCHQADGAERLRIFGKIRRTAALVFEALCAKPPAWLDQVGLIYEDVRFDGAPFALGPDICADLATVARELRPKIIRSHLYDFIFSHFVRRFGPEGETEDILEFLQSFLAREDFAELAGRAIAEDHRALQDDRADSRSRLSAGKSAAPPAVSVFFQIAAESKEAVSRGDYRIVINETGSGQGGLVGRFVDLLGPGDGDLAARLSDWVTSSRGRQPSLEVTVVGDWNNLHPVLGVTGKVLKWPSEFPTTEAGDGAVETLDLRDLRLRADSSNETLYFTDRMGRPVAPCYLGLVPASNFRDALGMLLFLIDPWVYEAEVGSRRDRRATALAPPREVEFYARRESGRLVLRRARWRFPVSAIPVRRKGEADFDFFLRVQHWRGEHGLPEEVFAAVERHAIEFDPKYRKPVWVNFGSPHSLELLRQILAEDAVAVTMTESLPTPGQHWVSAQTGDTDEKRVSEFIALVRWPMPEPIPQRAADMTTRQSTVQASIQAGQQEQWLYYKIYPAQQDQMEDVVRQIAGPARDAASVAGGLRRWFFVRYIDQQGLHLRLRLKVAPDYVAETNRVVEALIARAMPKLQLLPVPPVFPLDDLAFRAPQRMPHYVAAEYAPEYEKYGGPVGVEIAERLFELSSERALEVALAGPELWPLRETLSLRMMWDLVRCFHPDEKSQAAFLQYYFWYWSGQDRREAFSLRTRFTEVARSRAADIPEKLAALGHHRLLKVVANEYRAGLATTARELDQADLPIPQTRLCFDYLHMNNNRLGIKPVEEAYLAALLL